MGWLTNTGKVTPKGQRLAKWLLDAEEY